MARHFAYLYPKEYSQNCNVKTLYQRTIEVNGESILVQKIARRPQFFEGRPFTQVNVYLLQEILESSDVIKPRKVEVTPVYDQGLENALRRIVRSRGILDRESRINFSV